MASPIPGNPPGMDDGPVPAPPASTPQDDRHLSDALGRQRTVSDLTTRHTASMDSRREEFDAEQFRRLDDEITMLRAERIASRISEQQHSKQASDLGLRQTRSRQAPARTADDFNLATTLGTDKGTVYSPPEPPMTRFARAIKNVHSSYWPIRYFFYITPLAGLLIIPIALGTFVFPDALVGGVYLQWFAIWLEILWLSLWAGRILAWALPWPIGIVTILFSDQSKKWKDLAHQIEVALTLFLWGLATECSFEPIMRSHVIPNYQYDTEWMNTVNTVLIAVLVAVSLNLVEKIIIQLIAMSFHKRTYQDRIQANDITIGYLIHLYTYSRTKLSRRDNELDDPHHSRSGSGARTPLEQAQHEVYGAFRKFGDAAGKIAEDFTGRKSRKSTHPHQVVLVLLDTENGCKVLARRLFETLQPKKLDPFNEKTSEEEEQTPISWEDFRSAFEKPGADPEAVAEVAKDAFAIFDRDLNDDITAQELELSILETRQERKSILASLKDLDSVVSKLDQVLVWLVAIVTILVFVAIISKSAAGVLTSAGSTLLALSWLFSTSAQEFIGSLIFVFVKHPFDVGDRVAIYGNTGSLLKGNEYYVKEVSLLWTEFKKLSGQVVQAPNNYLNTLFILNMRRSGPVSESINLSMKFGTTLDQIDALRGALLEFVKSEPREYRSNIFTEVLDISDVWTVVVQVTWLYKSNWQNELTRLRRRNKIVCMMMHYMSELGIEGPQVQNPGYAPGNPMYINYNSENGGPIPRLNTVIPPSAEPSDGPPTPVVASEHGSGSRLAPTVSRARSTVGRGSLRSRGESVSSLTRRVDFSLGMESAAAEAPLVIGDVHDEAPSPTASRARSSSLYRGTPSTATSRPNRIATIAEEEPVPSPPNHHHRTRAPDETSLATSDRGSHRGSRLLGALRLQPPRPPSEPDCEEGRVERGSLAPRGSLSNDPRSPVGSTRERADGRSRSDSLWSRRSLRGRASLDR